MTLPTYQDLQGMSANERLFATGQLEEFRTAVARRDLAEVRKILQSIHVDEPAIEGTLENVRIYGTAHDPTWNPDGP